MRKYNDGERNGGKKEKKKTGGYFLKNDGRHNGHYDVNSRLPNVD